MFKPRFAALVESGAKLQTVRPKPKRMPQAGDAISLRCWTGLPYRSKQRVLREATISQVSEIVIAAEGISPIRVEPLGTSGALNYWPSPDVFAHADGFADWPEMREWFATTHGLPFAGIIIFWDTSEEARKK
ncbi:ASCH domain-containing protein [Geminisphaera colitermitum]|uniref:ASCH domain-containing protein n=1 Tax=Geminisphaera colitermitum TaxID=1148786 RepID=UPI0012FECF36|nr:ASCH domain-containing protein [Geminisphaera colitermitum]